MDTSPSLKSQTVLMVAGEASGDTLGAALIRALKARQPNLRVSGVGGHQMKEAGQDQLFDLAIHAVLGLTAVLRHYFKFRAFFYQLAEYADKEKPDAIVLIDYPGFNLRLAALLRRKLPDTKIIFYISPQVWAWKAGRVRQMKRDLDLLIVIFPFEVAWYAQAAPGFPVAYVGHPLVDRLAALAKENPAKIAGSPHWVALLPGSRKTEVSHNLPILWQAAGLIAQKLASQSIEAPFFRLLTPDETMRDFALDLLKDQPPTAAPVRYEVLVGKTLESVAPCAVALVASGTASLECTALGVPPVVVYKVNPLTWAVGRRLANVKHLSIVNIMGNGEVVPELLQDQFTAENVAEKAVSLLTDESYRTSVISNMARVISDLGTPGASDRAAELILKNLNHGR